MLMAQECLVIFAKPAQPGRVKTRLIGAVSPAQAAALHTAFLADLIEEMLPGEFDLRLAWALESGDERPTSEVPSMLQRGTDLGDRLHQGLRDLSARYPRVAVVGSDHPMLRVSLVQQAFDKLGEGTDVVLGPAEDGGYYLMAVQSHVLSAELFREIPWSTSAVLETTLRRCRALELRVEMLSTVPDVDTPEDLSRLVTELERDSELSCVHTRALLRSWNE